VIMGWRWIMYADSKIPCIEGVQERDDPRSLETLFVSASIPRNAKQLTGLGGGTEPRRSRVFSYY
jgi:hypothetical protein